MLGGGYESRRYTRCELDLPVFLYASGGTVYQGTIVDISISGLQVRTAEPIEIEGECALRFAADPEKPVEIRANVVERKSALVRFEIVGISSSCVEDFREVIVNASEDPMACDNQIISNMELMPELY